MVVQAQGVGGGWVGTTAGLYQAFLEWAPKRSSWVLTVGRQELAVGHAFMLGADGFLDGLSFDGVKIARRRGSWDLRLFAGRSASPWSQGLREDLLLLEATRDGGTWGRWGSYLLAERPVDSKDHWVSFGLAASIPLASRLFIQLESVGQGGSRRGGDGEPQPVRAFGGLVALTLQEPVAGLPGEAFFALGFGSGEGQVDDGVWTEFRNPFNDTPLLGESKLLGDFSGLSLRLSPGRELRASGLLVVNVGLALLLGEKLSLSGDIHLFRGSRVPSTSPRTLGTELNLALTWPLVGHGELQVSLNRFFPKGCCQQQERPATLAFLQWRLHR